VSARRRTGLIALLVAVGVSSTGTRMSVLALPWFVLVTTGSPARTGLVVFAQLLPYVVVQALAGPLVDRVGGRRASVLCDLLSAGVAASVPLLYALDRLSFPVLLALVALLGAARGPGSNAKAVLVPAVVSQSGMPLERATGLYDGVDRTASIGGAALAGVLIGLFGPVPVLLVDAATFLVAAALVLLVRAGPAAAVPGRYLARLREGLVFLRGDRLLVAITGMLLVTNLLDQAMTAVLVPVWARENTGEALTVGLIFGAIGVGATVGSLTAAVIGPRLPRRTAFLLAFVLAGSPRFAVLALGAPLPVVLAVSLAAGLGAGLLNPILGAVLYERIPTPLQARVLSVSTALAWAGMPFGALLGGWLTSAYGVTAALWIAGAAYLLATLLPLGRTWRGMDRPPPSPAAPPLGVAVGS